MRRNSEQLQGMDKAFSWLGTYLVFLLGYRDLAPERRSTHVPSLPHRTVPRVGGSGVHAYPDSYLPTCLPTYAHPSHPSPRPGRSCRKAVPRGVADVKMARRIGTYYVQSIESSGSTKGCAKLAGRHVLWSPSWLHHPRDVDGWAGATAKPPRWYVCMTFAIERLREAPDRC